MIPTDYRSSYEQYPNAQPIQPAIFVRVARNAVVMVLRQMIRRIETF